MGWFDKPPEAGFMDPGVQALLGLSQGLLAAGSPSRTPISVGGALAQGSQGALQNAMLAANFHRQETMNKLQEEKLKRDAEAAALFSTMYGPQASSPSMPQSVVATGEQRPGWMLPPTAQTAAPMGNGPSLAQIGKLGGIDPVRAKFALELWQAQNPDLDFSGGIPKDKRTGLPITSAPALPQTNAQGFSTTPVWNPQTKQFEVSITPGGEKAYGTQQDITNRSAAQFKPFLGQLDPQGRPIAQTEAQFADRAGGTGTKPSTPVPPGMGLTPAQKAAAEAAAQQGVGSIEKTYESLKGAPSTIEMLHQARDAIGPASRFMGPTGEYKLTAAKALKSVFGIDVDAEQIGNAEFLRSALFKQVSSVVKQVDSQPAQKLMDQLREAMGSLSTDPSALPRVMDITENIMRNGVEKHQKRIADAEKNGVQFPVPFNIELPAPYKQKDKPTMVPSAPKPAAKFPKGFGYLGVE